MAKLSKNVYEQLAAAIDGSRLTVGEGTPYALAIKAVTEVQREQIARAIALVLADNNAQFNMITFLNAAGFKP
jgi:hypothetical protein